jgi:hypothetical protein
VKLLMAVMTLVVLEAIMNYGSHYLKCKKKIIESAIKEMQIFWKEKLIQPYKPLPSLASTTSDSTKTGCSI